MMYSLMLLFILLAGIIPVHGEEGEVIKDSWYFTAYEGMESEPKCIVRRIWINVELLYTMMCVECSDRSFAVVRHEDSPIGAYRDVNCGHIQWSISVLPPQTMGSEVIHIVQVDLTNNMCARLAYQLVQDIYVPHRSTCVHSNHWKKFYLGWKNGWKEIKISPARGIVRKIIEMTEQTDDLCHEKQNWKHYRNSFSMRCFDCPEEYVVKTFKDNIEVRAVTVATCTSPDVERSVTVVETDTKEVFSVQYQMVTEECDMRTYTRDANGFHEHGAGQQCTNKPRWIIAPIMGYRNGWKKQKAIGTKPTKKE